MLAESGSLVSEPQMLAPMERKVQPRLQEDEDDERADRRSEEHGHECTEDDRQVEQDDPGIGSTHEPRG